MSQPLESSTISKPVKRQNSFGPRYQKPTVINTINTEQKNRKIKEFERNQTKYLQELNKLKRKQYTSLKNDAIGQYRVYYFIGRLNPPHNGHIEALKSLILRAQTENSKGNYKVIILLGSGPGKKQTLNDPLDFDLKRSVVVDLLRANIQNIDILMSSGTVLIEEMDKAAEQIATEIRIKILEVDHFISAVNKFKVDTIRVSGEKDGDVKKLAWIEQSLQKSIGQLLNIQLQTNVIGIAAVVNEGRAMSATQVRKDALSYDLEQFNAKYGQFYGSNTQPVYNAICAQATRLDPAQIQAYIDSGTLPKGTLPKAIKGGSRRKTRKTRKTRTKRRRTRKTKRRTNKRRRN